MELLTACSVTVACVAAAFAALLAVVFACCWVGAGLVFLILEAVGRKHP